MGFSPFLLLLARDCLSGPFNVLSIVQKFSKLGYEDKLYSHLNSRVLIWWHLFGEVPFRYTGASYTEEDSNDGKTHL